MKKTLLLSALALLLASAAFGVIDRDDNRMSLYLDLNADMTNIMTPPFVVVPVHVILTRPDFGAIFGYEFGYLIEGNHMVSGTILAGDGPIDVGGAPGNHIVGLAAPMVTTDATLLCTLMVFVLDQYEIYMTLVGATPNSVVGSEMPAVLLANDEINAIQPSCWQPSGNPVFCATINMQPFPVDQATWDEVKSLYR